MIWRHRLCAIAALALAGCGGPPDSATARADYRALLAAGDGVGAEVALRAELARGVGRPALAPFMGEAELLQGNLAEAQRWLGKADFAPEVAARGFHMLGRLRLHEGDLPAAGRAFDRALVREGDNPSLWVDIGRLRYRGGEHAQALEAAEMALALGPRDPAAVLFRAQIVRDARGNLAALDHLERGLVVAPNDPALLAEYAATLGELGRAADMLDAVRKLADVAPADPRVLWLQAVHAARGGQADLARVLLHRSKVNTKKVPAASLLSALIDMDNGNYASAALVLDRLARNQPDNERVARLLARSLSLGGNDRELVARFAVRAETPYYAALLARSYERLGDRTKAATLLDKNSRQTDSRLATLPTDISVDLARRRNSGDGATVVALVRGELARGGAGAARSDAGRFLARFPGSAEARALAGDAALGAGDPRQALAFYQEAATIRRPWSLAKRMVVALDRSGKPGEALALIAVHVANEPKNADAAAMLARRMAAIGLREKARTMARAALSLGRNDVDLVRIARGG